MKVFRIDCCEWWIGESLESCCEGAVREYGLEVDDLSDAEELTDEELDRLSFHDFGEDDSPTGVVRSFREEMDNQIKAGGQFPRMFASTEY